MKKTLALMVLGLGMLAGTNAFAQEAGKPADAQKTQQVVQSIPSLKVIADEIAAFEAKTSGRKEEYKNANADLLALKQKYANELNLQLALNKDKKDVAAVLAEELKRTNEEIANLKK